MSNKCAVVSSRFHTRGSLSKACVLAASAVALSLLGVERVGAANLQYDADANAANGANGGTGVWDLGTANWWLNGSDIAWTDITGSTDNAIFGGTAGTVTLGTNLGARGLTFNTAGYTIAGAGPILLGNQGIVATAVASGTTTIGPALTMTTNQTWNLGTGSVFNLTSLGEVAGGTNFSRSGGSTLNISGAAGWTGSTSLNAGKFDLGTTGTLASSSIGQAMSEFAFAGAGGTPRAISVSGTLTSSIGRSVVTLATDGITATSFTAGSLGNRGVYSTPLYRGTNLGSTVGAGNTNIFFGTAPTVTVGSTSAATFAALGTGNINTTQAAVIRGALADTSATGNGAGFATYDPAVGVRLLNAGERVTTYPAANDVTNVKLTLAGATAFTGRATNTLELSNTSGLTQTVTNSGTAFFPANGLLFSGTSAITLTGGTLTNTTAGSDTIILSTNTAGVTMTGLAFTNSGGSGERGIVFAGPGNITVGAVGGQGGNGAIAVNGPGTVTFNGAATVSSKGLTVSGGTAKLGTGFTLSSSRPFNVAPGGTIDTNGISVTNLDGLADNPNSLNTGGGIITNTSGTASTLTLSRGSGPGTSRSYSGVITGNINLVANGPASNTGVQTLSGLNTYTGSTQILSGPIRVGVNNALPTGTALTVNGGGATAASLDLAGFSQQVASLSGATNGATITNSSATTSTLTINGSANTVYASNINNGTGAIALVHAGTGTLSLTATNSYTGGTTITGGTLLSNNSNATGTGAVTVNGGILGGTGSTDILNVNSTGHVSPGAVASVGTLTTNGLTLNSGSIYDVDMTAGSSDKITSNNGLAVNAGAGVNLFIAGTNSPFATGGSYTLFSVPSGTIPTTGDLNSNFTILNPVGGVGYNWSVSGTDVLLTLTGGSVAATWGNSIGGAWGTAGNWVGGIVPLAAGDSAVFGTNLTSSDQVLLNGTKTVGSVTFNNSSSSYDIATGSGGTLTINNNAAIGSITNSAGNHTISANVNLVSNTNLSVTNSSDTLAITGNVSGGNINVLGGAGTVVLSGSNSYGTTTIATGNTLAIGNGGTTGTLGTGAITANGKLIVNRSDAVGISQGISGSGTLNNTGGGTTTITGTNSGTWGITIDAGAVNIGTGGATVAGTGPVALNGGPLTVNSSSIVTLGALSGTANLAQQGSGTLLLSTASPSYNGTVNVTSGALKFGASGSAGTGQINISNATLNENNVSTTHTNNIDFAGAVTIDTFGSTTMTLNGILSGNGTITRNAGTGSLSMGNNGANNAGVGNGVFTGSFSSTTGNVTFTRKEAGSAAAQWSFTGPTLTLSNLGGTIAFGSLNGTSPINASTGGSNRIRIGDLSAFSSTYSGAITGASILKLGSNSLTLSGQNSFTTDAITNLTGYSVVIAGGTLNAGSSSGGSTGPLGGPAQLTMLGNAAPTGNEAQLASATLATSGAVTVANPITVSAGTGLATVTPYTLTLAGNSDNNSSFTGAITLMNNLTVAQVVTTGANALTIAGNLTGTALNTGALATGPTDGPNNTGFQTVTFAGPGKINVTGAIADGTGVVSVASTGGTTTLAGAHTYTGATSANVGKLITNTAIQNGAAMSATNGGVIEIPVNGGATRVTSISSLTTTGTGSHINVHDNDLVINYGAGPSAYAATVLKVKSGLLSLGGTGTEGITSPEADGGIPGTSLAVVDNAIVGRTDLSGFTIPNPTQSVLVKFTWLGDANLDGVVDGTDYALTDSGFAGGGVTWDQGDYNYSGGVDGTDYALIDTGFGSQSGTLPEPTALGLLGLGAMGMLRRRRRQA